MTNQDPPLSFLNHANPRRSSRCGGARTKDSPPCNRGGFFVLFCGGKSGKACCNLLEKLIQKFIPINQQERGVPIVFKSAGNTTIIPQTVAAQTFATLDKGKQYKQQQNGLSTLPKTPPGKEKGGVFA